MFTHICSLSFALRFFFFFSLFSISFSDQSAGDIFSVFVCLKISLFCFYF